MFPDDKLLNITHDTWVRLKSGDFVKIRITNREFRSRGDVSSYYTLMHQIVCHCPERNKASKMFVLTSKETGDWPLDACQQYYEANRRICLDHLMNQLEKGTDDNNNNRERLYIESMF